MEAAWLIPLVVVRRYSASWQTVLSLGDIVAERRTSLQPAALAMLAQTSCEHNLRLSHTILTKVTRCQWDVLHSLGEMCQYWPTNRDWVVQNVAQRISSVERPDDWEREGLRRLEAGDVNAEELERQRARLEGRITRAERLFVLGN